MGARLFGQSKIGLAAIVVLLVVMLSSAPTSAQTGQYDVSGIVVDSAGTRLERAMVGEDIGTLISR